MPPRVVDISSDSPYPESQKISSLVTFCDTDWPCSRYLCHLSFCLHKNCCIMQCSRKLLIYPYNTILHNINTNLIKVARSIVLERVPPSAWICLEFLSLKMNTINTGKKYLGCIKICDNNLVHFPLCKLLAHTM